MHSARDGQAHAQQLPTSPEHDGRREGSDFVLLQGTTFHYMLKYKVEMPQSCLPGCVG